MRVLNGFAAFVGAFVRVRRLGVFYLSARVYRM